jgi:hypothetical protein
MSNFEVEGIYFAEEFSLENELSQADQRVGKAQQKRG